MKLFVFLLVVTVITAQKLGEILKDDKITSLPSSSVSNVKPLLHSRIRRFLPFGGGGGFGGSAAQASSFGGGGGFGGGGFPFGGGGGAGFGASGSFASSFGGGGGFGR